MRTCLAPATTAPKLEEPMGLGAVAEDPDGVHWVRIPDWFNSSRHAWLCVHSTGHWHHVQAVNILSEGVTP